MIGQNNRDKDAKRKKQILWLILLFLLFLMIFVIWFYWVRKKDGNINPESPKVEVEVEPPVGDSPPNENGGDNSNSITVDKTVNLPVMINTLGQTINAAEIHIKFNPDEIEVKEIVKSSSLFQYWIDNASGFNNTIGTVVLVGSLPSPGFKGSGLAASIKVLPKKEGKTSVVVERSTQVALNDGEGTIAETVLTSAELNVVQ